MENRFEMFPRSKEGFCKVEEEPEIEFEVDVDVEDEEIAPFEQTFLGL